MQYKHSTTNPISIVLQLIGAKWKILIVKELLTSDFRFCELKNKLGCTSKVLTNCLREMEIDGLIIRETAEYSPQEVRYYLSDIGYTLRPIIDAMQKWGKDYKKLKKLMEKANSMQE